MDGENNGKPYLLMDDLGGKPTVLGKPHVTPFRSIVSKLLDLPIRCLDKSTDRRGAEISRPFIGDQKPAKNQEVKWSRPWKTNE